MDPLRCEDIENFNDEYVYNKIAKRSKSDEVVTNYPTRGVPGFLNGKWVTTLDFSRCVIDTKLLTFVEVENIYFHACSFDDPIYVKFNDNLKNLHVRHTTNHVGHFLIPKGLKMLKIQDTIFESIEHISYFEKRILNSEEKLKHYGKYMNFEGANIVFDEEEHYDTKLEVCWADAMVRRGMYRGYLIAMCNIKVLTVSNIRPMFIEVILDNNKNCLEQLYYNGVLPWENINAMQRLQCFSSYFTIKDAVNALRHPVSKMVGIIALEGDHKNIDDVKLLAECLQDNNKNLYFGKFALNLWGILFDGDQNEIFQIISESLINNRQIIDKIMIPDKYDENPLREYLSKSSMVRVNGASFTIQGIRSYLVRHGITTDFIRLLTLDDPRRFL